MTRLFFSFGWAFVDDAQRLGWLPPRRLPATHHDRWSTPLEWRCCCGREAVYPVGARG